MRSQEHWFSFGDCCLAVTESFPAMSDAQIDKQSLFFLHGRFGHAEMWQPLVFELSKHYRCLRIDLPGFGRSFTVNGRGMSLMEQASLVQALIERFGKGQAVLIGHDVGGAIAQLCAAHAPDAVSALVLINSDSPTHEPRSLKTGWMCLRARATLRRLFGAASLIDEHKWSLSKGWQNRLARAAMARAFEAWEYTWPGPAERFVWRRRLSRLRHPILVLWGRRDPIHPSEHAEELLRQFPDAYLFSEDDCGHWPCLERMEWVHLKLREFLFRVRVQTFDWRYATS